MRNLNSLKLMAALATQERRGVPMSRILEMDPLCAEIGMAQMKEDGLIRYSMRTGKMMLSPKGRSIAVSSLAQFDDLRAWVGAKEVC